MVAAPFVLGAVGFTSVGIAAGSYAAGMMSAAAIANGGAVAAGSTVAVLTSTGDYVFISFHLTSYNKSGYKVQTVRGPGVFGHPCIFAIETSKDIYIS